MDGALVERSRQFRREPAHAERVLWQEQRGRRLAGLRSRRQQIMDGFAADCYRHGVGVVVEVGGPIHDAQRKQDAARDALIAANDIRVVRVTNDDALNNLNGVLERIISTAAHKQN